MKSSELPSPESADRTVKEFHRLYYNAGVYGQTWSNTLWLGVPAQKCPLDLWVYQEIICEKKPDIIIECGTASGGTALFLASLCELLHHGKVLTIDIEERDRRPSHKLISYLHGSSTSERIEEKVKSLIKGSDSVMAILDSDHTKEHVLRELRIYSQLVTKGNYLIVEDTNINNHPVLPDFGPGPMEAVETFLKETADFVIDVEKEKFFMTFNPNGFLRKIK